MAQKPLYNPKLMPGISNPGCKAVPKQMRAVELPLHARPLESLRQSLLDTAHRLARPLDDMIRPGPPFGDDEPFIKENVHVYLGAALFSGRVEHADLPGQPEIHGPFFEIDAIPCRLENRLATRAC